MIKKLSKRIGMLMMALTMVVATGCSTANKGENATANADNSSAKTEEITITHMSGETTLNKNPERVVVFDYGVLDSLDKMGVDIVGLPKQTLPTYLDKYKDEKYGDLGTLKEPNFEKIFEADPDLIIISGRQEPMYDEFTKIAPTINLSTSNEEFLDSVKNNVVTLGKIFSKEDLVSQEFNAVEEKIKKLNEKASAMEEKGLVIMVNDGAISAYGKVSRFGIIHNEFGVKPADPNIEVSQHGQSISFEYIAKKDPDYLFVIDRTAVVGGSTGAKQVLENEMIKNTEAYKNNNIVYLDSAIWYTAAGGFNSTIKMVEEIESAITK